MKNKKTIAAISSILIIIFHFWINISNSIVEEYLRQVCVIGVDLFFFISVYSLSKKEEIKYKEFIKNRFINVYLKFIILTILVSIIKSWSIKKIIFTILGIDLFISGGGSFLWFIPGIMIVYLLIPFFIKLVDKNLKLSLIVVIISYVLISLILTNILNYREIFILLNRVPVMLLAFYLGKYNIIDNLSRKKYNILLVILLILGNLISYYVIVNKIKIDFIYDIFYVLNVPLEIGIVLLLNKIKANKVINVIGDSTLEIYGLQMIFGFKLANRLLMLMKSKILTNLSLILILILISVIVRMMYEYIYRSIKKYRET